uniref:Nascent polypeptide-associated complex subunit alpha-like UBA domain-containing protein n=1 Tax=Cryptomonas curvata TaxID=233186 RepID=A0A6T8DQ46_9CRYP
MTEREDDDEEESQVVRKGDDAKAHKELNKLGGDMDGEKEVDTGKAQDALTKLAASEEAEKARKLERERELAKVKIERADVELIMTEMEVEEGKAERILRENNGDPIAALRAMINGR